MKDKSMDIPSSSVLSRRSVVSGIVLICALALLVTLISISSLHRAPEDPVALEASVPVISPQVGREKEDLTILGPILDEPPDLSESKDSFISFLEFESSPPNFEGLDGIVQQNYFQGPPIVNILDQGQVLGTVLTSRRGRQYYGFYQIPYASPPVGKLRFEPPQLPTSWKGIRDGTAMGPQCIQKDKYNPTPTAVGDENCLHLNIYTPTLRNSPGEPPNLPVLVYVHGGGQYGNGTRYGGKYFMDQDVILVTFEFRLGILGGFSTGTTEYPGNIGSKDQVLALRWVQKNIASFGGDAKRVMIFGNSSGATAVHSLLLSKMTKGLFSSAILQSGNSIQISSMAVKDPRRLNEILAKEAGCEVTNELVECLRNLNAKDLVLSEAQTREIPLYKEPAGGNRETTFLEDYPWNLIGKGEIADVPLIVGDVSEEFMGGEAVEYLVNPYLNQELNDQWDLMLPGIVGIRDDGNHSVAHRFREMYFGNRPIDNDTRMELTNLFSDSLVHSQRISALTHAQKTGQSTYLYWLTKRPAKSYGQKYVDIFPPPYGVSHADELQYFFLYDGYPEITVNSPWFDYSEALVKMWASFAATGKPESPGVEWREIYPEDKGMRWYELGDGFREIEPITRRMLLWDDYIDQLYSP